MAPTTFHKHTTTPRNTESGKAPTMKKSKQQQDPSAPARPQYITGEDTDFYPYPYDPEHPHLTFVAWLNIKENREAFDVHESPEEKIG
ncbi:hypothetical protein PRZ48_011247 [Zasmidium cellare]|uniref:Uncharacterized protein n=1 Tax=Zasmidium cellare TaxID=395010 RepID=A0ABR0EAV0_ZASCE|nr:hypothetical protein PRZ48_011247 [Zasmidium cellare]